MSKDDDDGIRVGIDDDDHDGDDDGVDDDDDTVIGIDYTQYRY